MWTSDRRLYLDAAGNVVEAGDRNRATLLVCAGGQIPKARAKALGLIHGEPFETESTTGSAVAAEVVEVEVVVTDEHEEKAEEPKEDKAEKPVSDNAVKPSRNKSK